MRRASTLLAVLCAVAVAAVVVTGLLQRSSLAFTLGVAPSVPAAEPVNGRAVCQSPIAVPAAGAFDRIRLEVDPRGRPGPALEAQVRDRAAGGRVIARGTLAAGYGK